MGQVAGAEGSAKAGTDYRFDSVAARQHALHGDSAYHTRLPEIRGRVRRRRGGGEHDGGAVPPRPRFSHGSVVRLEGHSTADGEPVLGRVDRQDRLRHTHDDRPVHHVPVHRGFRLRPKLRGPLLREKPAGSRLSVRRHQRPGDDRRPLHGGGGTVEGPGDRPGLHQFRLPGGATVRRCPLPIRGQRGPLPDPRLHQPGRRRDAAPGDEAGQGASEAEARGDAPDDTDLAAAHGPVHSRVRGRSDDVERRVGLPRAYHLPVDGG